MVVPLPVPDTNRHNAASLLNHLSTSSTTITGRLSVTISTLAKQRRGIVFRTTFPKNSIVVGLYDRHWTAGPETEPKSIHGSCLIACFYVHFNDLPKVYT